MRMNIKFNLNDQISVKLNDYGWELIEKYKEQIKSNYSADVYDKYWKNYPELDRNGYWTDQFHNIFSILGDCFFGLRSPFVNNEIIFEVK